MAKKKQPTFVRTTISLPASLRKSMKACGEDVNWSAIAAQAFAAEVARINTRKEGSKMDDVIERLRASEREEGTALFEQGRELGIEWAKTEASAIELRRLKRAFDSTDYQYRTVHGWLEITRDSQPACDQFVEYIRPRDSYGSVVESDEFWEFALGDYISQKDESEFVHGFADGAVGCME